MFLYNKKYALRMPPGGHKYLINEEEKVSATQLLKILDKPGLPQWAANQTIDAIRNSTPQIETSIGYGHLVTENDLRQAKRAFMGSRDASANLGTMVHKWIETHIKNILENKKIEENYTDDMRPSIQSFLKWEAEYKPKYLFSERVIYSEKGDYCGTCDVGIELDGKRVILDFKTGKPEGEYDKNKRRYTGRKRAYSTVFIQDALYDLAIEEEDGVKADRYGALYLSTNGELLFRLTNDTAPFRKAARAITKTYQALQEINTVNKFE